MGTHSLPLWQADGESAASTLRVADGNTAAVRMADFFGDGEAKAKMPFMAARGIRLIEAVEYFFLIGARNAYPGINNLNITFVVRAVNV